MSEQIKLVRTADWQSDISSLEISNDQAGWSLVEDGWIPATIEEPESTANEVLNLLLQSTSQNDAATKIQSLRQKVREGEWAKKQAERYQIWLRDQTRGETNPRQAVCRAMRFSLDTPLHDHPMTLDYMARGTLAIERGHWENTTSTTCTNEDVSGIGGTTSPSKSSVTGEVVNTNYTINGTSYSDGTLANPPIAPGTVTLVFTVGDPAINDATDDGNGLLLIDAAEKGTINYTTGAWVLNEVDLRTYTTTASYGAALNLSSDLPGRIASVSFGPHAGSGAIEEMWFGFKTNEHVTLANWFGVWDLEYGSIVVGTDTALNEDATAHGTSHLRLRCNFDTIETMTTRVTLTPLQLSESNYEDLRGSYKILARMKVDTGYTCRVRLGYGIGIQGVGTGASAIAYNEAVTVTNTAWYFYDLGDITLPVGGAGSPSYSAMANSAMLLQAQLYSGTQDNAKYLSMDCFVAIPIDEGCGHIKSGSGQKQQVLIDALGRVTGYDYTGTAITGSVDTGGINPKDCVMPVGTSKIIVAAQRASSSVLADACDVELIVFPRWKLMRGSA